jgi:hypothetical protein
MEHDDLITDCCRITKLNHGIIKCEFIKDFYYSTELAWQIFEACNQLAESSTYKMLWIMNTKLQPQKELFDFYANEKRSLKINSEAFCINSTAIKLMANFYFRTKKPKIVSKVFDSETLAIEWLIVN